jgi:hypothetical protein
MVDRQQNIANKGWGDSMCLDNGSLIDNAVFLCKYKLKYPNETVRFIIWQKDVNDPGIEDATSSNPSHEGIGEIADSRMVDCLAVYTKGSELHVRHPRCGDLMQDDYKASQIRTLTNKQLCRSVSGKIIDEQPVGSLASFEVHQTARPKSVSGDDNNLQVYYAQAQLKEIGTTAIVVPATEQTGPNNDKMLIFAINHTFYVWRPYFGAYRLAKDAFTQLGIKPDQIADSATH